MPVSTTFVEAVLVDLDGTLCDTRHRDHLVSTANSDWDKHSKECVKDEPIPSVMVILNLLAKAGYYIVLCSGRSEIALEETEAWLVEYEIPYDRLILRQKNDKTSNGQYKLKTVNALNEEGIEVALVIDDYYKVRELLEDVHGIPVLQVKSYTGHGEEATKQ